MHHLREDALHSVRRYLAEMLDAEILDDPWQLSLERREVRDKDRPRGTLSAGALAGSGRSAIPQGDVTAATTITVTLYPEVEGSDRACSRRAVRLADDLDGLVRYGLTLPALSTGRPRCGPYRVPLYDYSDVEEGEPGPAEPYGMLRLDEPATRTTQDPEDPRRWTVVLEVRVEADLPGRVGPSAPVVTGVPGSWDGPTVTRVPGSWDG